MEQEPTQGNTPQQEVSEEEALVSQIADLLKEVEDLEVALAAKDEQIAQMTETATSSEQGWQQKFQESETLHKQDLDKIKGEIQAILGNETGA